MFAQQSRAQFAPMNVPPGSPRQSGFGGKGGGASAAPAGGGKGGGRQMAPRNFDNNPGQQAGLFGFANQMMGGPAIAPSPSPTMFGQGNLNTAIGSGLQSLPAMPSFGPTNLSQAIDSRGMSALPPAQPVAPSTALPQGIIARLYGGGVI